MADLYQGPSPYSDDDIRNAIELNDVELLRRVVVSVSMHHGDPRFAGDVCLVLASHCDEQVRGNAILGMGHLARRFGDLDAIVARPLIEKALADPSKYVRGQAWAAADDVTHFLGWTVEGFAE